MCPHYTSPDAHTRKHFFLLSVSHFTRAHSAWLKLFKGHLFCVHFHLVPWCCCRAFLVVLSHKSYPHLPAHCPDLQRPYRPREEAAEKTLVHPPAGVGYLAEWQTQLQTQVMSTTSPTSSGTWTRSTRRSTSLTATTISRASTTPPWCLPQKIQKVCRIQEHPAAASKQQLAAFPQCSDPRASGNRWQARELGRFWTENLLQQWFLVHSRKGREIEIQTLCFRWRTEIS